MVLKRTLFSVLIVLAFAFFAAGTSPSNSSSGGSSSSTSQVSDEECRKSLQCWGEKHMVSAAVRCREPIERLAKNNFEWTDGILEPKFSHYRWKNQPRASSPTSATRSSTRTDLGPGSTTHINAIWTVQENGSPTLGQRQGAFSDSASAPGFCIVRERPLMM
jgi:hypothetical protein